MIESQGEIIDIYKFQLQINKFQELNFIDK